MIPLGILASAGVVAGSDYELIQAIATTNTTTSSVTFSSIPQTYRHLELRISSRSRVTSGNDWLNIRMNGDTTNNYFWHRVSGSGPNAITVQGQNSGTTNQLRVADLPGTQITQTYAPAVVQIMDYTSTTKHKTLKSFTGFATDLIWFEVNLYSGVWRAGTIAAVNSLTVFPNFSTFDNECHVALYGIKG